jgi:uncharacterized protein YggL (DUF469 family)
VIKTCWRYFKMKKPVGVQIEGSVYKNSGNDLEYNEFFDTFIEFIEQKGWSFGGGGFQIDQEGIKVDDIE